ncbi:MAG: [acyl-carrier-protein] S-malonyltransferase [Hydrogenophilales bacterium CG03_land_8_20_14_0_80_62_28]|nr:ACP S-malonyltransferase [Betaproteobacteria bacterium]PIV22930.1 MAG: [acyl-carrier-protein] S-malonyltransferase [Hydrogenophilales bacterium CG03_land_8_20_14_0_80_62_28]PIW38019.1 MAG: [acyl-carrier-protein] S-malonyltransferase [Hydrogenophilales bacterium CG15_BIG_FIL_POST_REV_8_21_14_020_62_31]PIW72297.1 MAG: [acyl-carrier-protein] S-malonyltransferase [Hydrogenophilales bacterium CG12_big_fil_rev_8_21_14_0_65_61_21]PIX00590.1 MAG: [acyl-carrier-protein] S-malonyltransferase [Hydrogen
MTLAFVFPGQGSQSVGMMAAYGDAAAIRDTFAEASDALAIDLTGMIAEGPAEALNQTVNTQPAMLAAGVAVYRLWLTLGGAQPALMAGHSLGEYTALTCAGALNFADALRLVRLRAEAMQSAVPDGVGAMAAILGLDDDAIRAVCAEAAQGEVLAAVNFNSPGQVVIAGHKTAVDRGCALAKQRGAKRALPLPVSVPSHCDLMRPAAEKLLVAMNAIEIKTPVIPVIHNADVAAHNDPAAIRDALARQLYSPVRWVETMQAFAAQGVTRIAECGPGKVLTGLNKRILADVPTLALADAAALVELRDINTSRLKGETDGS